MKERERREINNGRNREERRMERKKESDKEERKKESSIYYAHSCTTCFLRVYE